MNAGARSGSTGNTRSEEASAGQAKEDTAIVDDKKLEESIQKLNEKLHFLNREIQFKVDKKINRSYISVIDKKTKEVIKEFPPAEIRHFIAQLRELDERSHYNRNEVKDLLVDVQV